MPRRLVKGRMQDCAAHHRVVAAYAARGEAATWFAPQDTTQSVGWWRCVAMRVMLGAMKLGMLLGGGLPASVRSARAAAERACAVVCALGRAGELDDPYRSDTWWPPGRPCHCIHAAAAAVRVNTAFQLWDA